MYKDPNFSTRSPDGYNEKTGKQVQEECGETEAGAALLLRGASSKGLRAGTLGTALPNYR